MGRISALTELTSLANNDYLLVLDSSANIAKKITVANAFGIPDAGWTATGETWTYASATTITVPSDATTKYSAGMVVKITQTTGGTKYGVITAVTSTLLTISWNTGSTLANETISTPFYSSLATPYGFGRIKPAQLNVTFSTSETLTGNYWTDGRPIYRKVVNMGAAPNNTFKDVAHGVSNLDVIINLYGVSGTQVFPNVPSSSTGGGIIETLRPQGTTDLRWRTTYAASGNGYAVMEYVKL